jgi:hypothetical protein
VTHQIRLVGAGEPDKRKGWAPTWGDPLPSSLFLCVYGVGGIHWAQAVRQAPEFFEGSLAQSSILKKVGSPTPPSQPQNQGLSSWESKSPQALSLY